MGSIKMTAILMLSIATPRVSGNIFSHFFEKHRSAMEKLIMAGYGDGWSGCDLLLSSGMKITQDMNPQWVTNIEGLNWLKGLDFWPKSSQCVLVAFQVSARTELNIILEFGREAMQFKRMGLFLELESGIQLESVKNHSGLPFPVAAIQKDNNELEEEYLCPTVGQKNPNLGNTMCDHLSSTSIRGKRLRIGVLGFKPYVTMDRRDELGRPDGTDMRLLRLLEDKMGFTADINFITSFRGVVEEAYSRGVDVAFNRNGYIRSRYALVDYLRPLGSYSFHFLSGKPRQIQSLHTVIRPFDSYTWTFLLCSVVTVALTLTLIDIAYARLHGLPEKDLVYHGISIPVGAIVAEPLEDHHIRKSPSATARDVLILEWIVLGFCLTVSYKSVLLATLVSAEYEKPIDTVADMLSSDKVIVGPAGTSIPLQMRTDPRESVRTLSTRIKFVPFNGTIPKWIQEGTANGELVQITSRETILNVRNGHQLHLGRQQVLSLGVAFVVPKASPLKRQFHMAVAWWMDTGIYAKMLSDVLTDLGEIERGDSSKSLRSDEPLSMRHLLASFVLLAIGLFITAAAFACEHSRLVSKHTEGMYPR